MKVALKVATLSAAALGALIPMTPASAQFETGGIMYYRTYYDDPGMTIQVGFERDTCNRFGVGGGRTVGRYGPYVQTEPFAYCTNGEVSPY